MPYFSGHGSQQPVVPGSRQAAHESDGWHKTFLPIDIDRWDGQRGAVSNAIVDHELRAAVTKVQDRGSFVWGVFDTCHSARLVPRSGAAAEIRYRAVEAQALGDPQSSATHATAKRAMPDGNDPAPTGCAEAVFFYATQTTDQTPRDEAILGCAGRATLRSFQLQAEPRSRAHAAHSLAKSWRGLHCTELPIAKGGQ